MLRAAGKIWGIGVSEDISYSKNEQPLRATPFGRVPFAQGPSGQLPDVGNGDYPMQPSSSARTPSGKKSAQTGVVR